jgi:Domain of Unknown Function (DUF1080)
MRKTSIVVGMTIGALHLAGSSLCLAADTTKINPGAGQATQWTFDKDLVGSLPAGATVFTGNWAVRSDSDAPSPPNVLCQKGKADYPALSLSDTVYADVTVTTRFKAISGKIDRAAGIIFRIKDKNNYYILRANALEDNVNIYKYVGGWRRAIQEGSVKVPSGTWQELRVDVKGNHIRGFLNGMQVVEANDDAFKSGKIGLWTKEDSVTCFDSVRMYPGK